MNETTDPAARAALIRSLIAGGTQDVLDELVRAGVLREETEDSTDPSEPWCPRRLVTAWEPVTPSQDAEP